MLDVDSAAGGKDGSEPALDIGSATRGSRVVTASQVLANFFYFCPITFVDRFFIL